VFNFYHPLLDIEFINFIVNRLKINLLESKVKTKGIIEKLYCVRVVFFNFFYKKVNNLNLEGINSYKTYYSINILFSGNTFKKKINNVYENIFGSGYKQSNQIVVVSKPKKKLNIIEFIYNYYSN
jgi:hypothetical protein